LVPTTISVTSALVEQSRGDVLGHARCEWTWLFETAQKTVRLGLADDLAARSAKDQLVAKQIV
jgi:hypothetical protein